MAAVIITQKDVNRLAKELLKEIFDFLHDEYILSTFEEMKEEKNKFLRGLVLGKFRSVNFTTKQKGNTWGTEYEKFDESKFEDELKSIKEEIENGSLNINLIFNVLNSLDLDMEIHEDLFYKNEAFLNIFNVFDSDYSYLKD